MRMRHIGTLGAAALALLGAASAAAQTPPVILNALEVRQLVGRAEPGDHARLGAHFVALADQYAREAGRHTAMAKAMGGNPNRRSSGALGAHCARLAELNTESAATLGELAAHHDALAAGAPSYPPIDGARFENGEGAPAPDDRELALMAAAARTAADHAFLEEYFVTLAARYTAGAEQHAAMASAYRANASRRGGDPAVHCDRLVTLSRQEAAEARAAAAEHRNLAPIGR